MLSAEEKAEFPPGPWMDEPDHVEFEHAGLPCILHRNQLGAWCGYAAVPPGHPWHGKDYSARVPVAKREDVQLRTNPIAMLSEMLHEDDGCVSLDALVCVHGGLTYAAACQGDICHKAKPGDPDDVWWFGFDCAHSGDIVPGLLKYGTRGFDLSDEYCDQAYVTAETKQLAEQLAAAAAPKAEG